MVLTVLNVAYSLATVGPGTVGGAEQVLGYIDRALVDAGATSIVVSCHGSEPAGRLEATPAIEGELNEPACTNARAAHAKAIVAALDRYAVDVVHLHGIDFNAYLPPPGVPTVATLHLPVTWYPPEALSPQRPGTFLTCVSRAQRRSCPSSAIITATIENGVRLPPQDLTPHHMRAGVVALGRICPEKGLHLALDAARHARVPITLAGRVFPYPSHRQYFANEIVPRLSASSRFIGPVEPPTKWQLLADARCVLVPSLAPETSSLVAMEAMACGTPVVAFRAGALPEIVEEGVTGFIVDDVHGMAEAISATAALDPEACRDAARERFSASRMTREYLELYERLVHGAHGTARSDARDACVHAA